MSEGARFCTACGSGLVEGAGFCTSCGAPAASIAAPVPVPAEPQPASAPPAAPAPASAPATGGERTVAVIPNAALIAGFMGMKSKSYTIVLTTERMVFARLTMAMMKQLVADARGGAKADGKGFFGQWGAQLKAYSAFAQGYLAMPIDQVLAETPENFAIPNASIVKAKIKIGHTDADNNQSADRLIIKTTDKKYRITLTAGGAQAKKALIEAGLI